MKLFEAFGDNLSYKDILQLDGAFSVAHVNYRKAPSFNGVSSNVLAADLRKESLSSVDIVENVTDDIRSFDGTKRHYSKDDQESLWKSFWLEYVNAFDKLTSLLPNSVVTVYVGRQAIEIGFKYLLFKKTNEINFTHRLDKLSSSFFFEYKINDGYMQWVDDFCKLYSSYIEGGNVEYFRYPEYKNDTFFAGNCLDIKWLSYNFALILLKLLYFAKLDVKRN